MGKSIITGNWKMHLSVEQSRDLAERIEKAVGKHLESVDVVICPSFTALSVVAGAVKKISVGAQNAYLADEGAFTGEVSASQLKGLASFVIVGHSERRQVFGETSETVARKAAACLRNGLSPIICVGETGYEREHGETVQVINDQLATSLTMLTASEIERVVIAYEPVWAIGTGDNADPDDVKMAISTIKSAIREMFGESAVDKCRILYGGSVAADSAGSYLDIDGVDGLLVGGASLNDQEFGKIVEKASHGK